MLLNYAHGRAQLPAPTVTVSNGGSITVAKTLYFTLQGQNPIGCNLQSPIVGPITVSAGQQITIALPPLATGESFDSFVVSASESNTPNSFVQVATTTGANIILNTDEHLKLSEIVLDPAHLPTTSLIPGIRRGVSSLATVFEYDPTSIAPVDDLTVLSASPGRWLRVGGFSTYVAKTTDPGGCAQDVRSIDESLVKVRSYSCDGSAGSGFRFWLVNDSDDAIASGKRVMIAVTMNEVARSGLFEGLLRCIFRGYVNTSTGILRTTDSSGEMMSGVNAAVAFENQKTDLILEDDLQPDEAYVLDIYPQFTPEELNNQILNRSTIKISLGLALQAGAYVEGGSAWGDRMYPEYDRGLVLPGKVGALCLKRSGMVNSRSFLAVAPTHVLGLGSNRDAQPLYINSNGSAYLKASTEPKEDTEAIRALIGTLPGISSPSVWSQPVTFSAGRGLNVTCTYPSNGTTATVRSTYPDPLIAGNSKAQFNPPFVVLYVRSTVNGVATIKQFDGRLIVDGASQTFSIANWNEGTTISAVPVAAPNFSLFESLSATAIAAGSGTIPAGTIEVCFAYEYDGTQVTSLSHSSLDGCLHTSTLTLSQVEEASQYWAEAVSTIAQLRAITLSRIVPYQARYVAALEASYWFNAGSTLADDGERVIKPDTIAASSPGRWIQTASNRFLTFDQIPTEIAGIGDLGIVLKTNVDDPDHGKVYSYDGSGWILRGILKGQRGAAGERGRFTIFSEPPTSDISGETNEVGFVLSSTPTDPQNGKVYRLTANSGWQYLGKLGGGSSGSGGSGGSDGGSSSATPGGIVLTPDASNNDALNDWELFLRSDYPPGDSTVPIPVVVDKSYDVHAIALLDQPQTWAGIQTYQAPLRYAAINADVDTSNHLVTIDVNLGNFFSVNLSDGDWEIRIINYTEDTSLEYLISWSDEASVTSIRYSQQRQGYSQITPVTANGWLDRPLAPDFDSDPRRRYRVRVTPLGYYEYAPAISMPELDPETESFLSKTTGYYSDLRKSKLDAIVRYLKREDLWNRATLYLMAAPNVHDARLTFSGLGGCELVTSNPFKRNFGFTTNTPIELPCSSYGGGLTIGVWSMTSDALAGTDFGAEYADSNRGTELRARSLDSSFSGRINAASTIGASTDSGLGWFAATAEYAGTPAQNPTNTNRLYRNGVQTIANTAAWSGSIYTDPLKFVLGGRNQQTGTNKTIVDAIVRQYAIVLVSRDSWTPAQHEGVYAVLKDYLTTILPSGTTIE